MENTESFKKYCEYVKPKVTVYMIKIPIDYFTFCYFKDQY